MSRGIIKRALNPEQLDEWFDKKAENQYTRELQFSSIFERSRHFIHTIKP